MTPDRAVTCTNKDGTSITFGARLSPFLLIDVDGLYGYESDVNTEDNAMIDGATYYGSTVKKRNIVLTVGDRGAHWANRTRLYDLFRPKQKGTLTTRDGSHRREIEYIVEKVTPSGTGSVRQTEISLICPDPYFYAESDSDLEMGYFVSEFEFPFYSEQGTGFEFGSMVETKSVTVNIGNDDENRDAVDGVGLEITVTANGGVSNPVITCSQGGEEYHLKLSKDLAAGDVLTITTATGNKKIQVNGKNAINALTEDSTFVQLKHGENTFSYGADSGAASMAVKVKYRMRYAGA